MLVISVLIEDSLMAEISLIAIIIAIFSIHCNFAINVKLNNALFKYFKDNDIGNVALFTCNDYDAFNLIKKLNLNGFTLVSILQSQPQQSINNSLTVSQRIGVVVDLSCPEAIDVLEMASTKKFFDNHHAWILLWNNEESWDEFENATLVTPPSRLDVDNFFNYGTSGVTFNERVKENNEEINKDVLMKIQMQERREVELSAVPSMSRFLLNIEALVDSEIILLIPMEEGVIGARIIYKHTHYSPLVIEDASEESKESGSLILRKRRNRDNFQGAILRAGCYLHSLEYFRRSEELTASDVDYWAQMIFIHSQLIEEILNASFLIRCFSEIGNCTSDGKCTDLAGFLNSNNVDLTATGLLLENDLLNTVDYIDSTYEFPLGMLFREPTLSQVSNIFVLPFSTGVWLTAVLTLVVAGGLMFFQLRLSSENVKFTSIVGDAISFITGAVCQQGSYINESTVAIRVSMLVVLVSTIFLFTAYTAAIVALLTSQSNFVNDLDSFIQSPLKFGIENLTYERQLFEEDNHESLLELKRKRVWPQGENAFSNLSTGLERVRNGLHAFQCDLGNAYKKIEETYSESEKCNLKMLRLFPNRLLGPAVPKKSPYRDIISQKMKWLREVGMTDRIRHRWLTPKPKCQSAQAGFASIGVKDIAPLLLVMSYGLVIAIAVFLVEFVAHPQGFVASMLSRKAEKRLKSVPIVQKKANLLFMN